ncbi:MAG: biotin--[acetyl-CoA-carboxylase] ligase [Candidatus Marinimicrobia bacterium]|nr:biotin--[acetyl-CoA-carboxylase] ligase [Candidatus Neomarinimicrobiota bacterium]
MLFTNLVQANLKTRILGKHIEYYTRLESTNSEAWELINDGCENGTVIVTDNQYSGKGRGNRNWYATPNKSLSFSIVLSPNINSKFSNWIPLISCIAIQKAIAAFSTTVEFKYPNDIMFGKKKLGGILCESKVSEKKINQAVIGIGINVNEEIEDFDIAIKNTATSLHINSKRLYQKERVLAEILNQLEIIIDQFPSNIDLIKSNWEDSCNHMNQKITFHYNNKVIKGIFKSLSNSGNAILQIKGEEKEYFTGEII